MNTKALFSGLLALIWTFSVAQISLQEINEYIEKSRIEWDVPGMAVAIVKDGQIVLSKGYGIKDVTAGELVDEHTLFAIASNTKAFISSALSILVSEAQLSWDDKVADYLPYFEMYDHYVSREATIRDLLCHRIGLGTFSGDMIWYKSNLQPEDLIRRIKYLPQQYPFRAGYGYSNLMFITAGEVIREVTGMTWDEFVGERILQPLGMERTRTSMQMLESTGNYARPHKPVEGENIPIEWVNWDNMGAAGGIISSANDMALWLLLNLNEGRLENQEILNSEQINILRTPHNNHYLSQNAKERIPGRHFSGYGLGWSLSDYFGRMLVSHGGGYDGMYSRTVLVPDENLGIVILTNSMKGISTPLSYFLVNAFIGEDMRDWSSDFLPGPFSIPGTQQQIMQLRNSRVEDTKPSISPGSYAGTYFAPLYGNIQIVDEGGMLRLYFEHSPLLSADLVHWHYDTFEIRWDHVHAWFDFGLVRFKLDNQLHVKGLDFEVPNNDIFFEELLTEKME